MSSEKSEILVAGNGEVATKSAIQKIAEKFALIVRARTLKNRIDYTGTEWCNGGVGAHGETLPMWRVKCATERWSWAEGYTVTYTGSATLDGARGLVYTDSRSGRQVSVRPADGLICTLCAEDTPENSAAVAELVYSVEQFMAACELPTLHDLNNA